IERRSLAGLGFDPDPATVHFDDALGDRQAKTGPALLARDRAVGLLELLEDLGLIGRSNSGAGVADRNRERSVRRLGSDRHFASLVERDRVADQVEQDRREPRPVSAAGGQMRRDLGLEGEELLGSKGLARRYHYVHNVSQEILVERKCKLARLNLR